MTVTAMGKHHRPSDRFALLLVDKPRGPTSHDVVDWVRWSLGERAVGHCGTLDPAATGLLVVCVGAATRLASDLTAVDKAYRATFRFGTATDTGDADGQTIASGPLPEGFESVVRSELATLPGELQLPPPVFSAVRVNGQRAHERARTGDLTALEPRPMHVIECDPIAFRPEPSHADVVVDVTVSKGTYIRSLATELARRTGVPCHLAALERTRCGHVALRQASVLTNLRCEVLPGRTDVPRWRIRGEDALDRAACRALIESYLVDPAAHLPFPVVRVSDVRERAIVEQLGQGQRIPVVPNPLAMALGSNDCIAERFGVTAQLDDGQDLFVVVERVGDSDPVWAPCRVIRRRQPA